MIKNLLFIYCLLIISFEAVCQPTLTTSIAVVPIGQSVSSYKVTDTIFPSQMNGGINQSWNINIQNLPSYSIREYIDPATTPFNNVFSSSNLCTSQIYPNDSSWSYINSQASFYDALGSRFYSNGLLNSIDYIDPIRSFVFPMNYGSNHTDSYEYITNSSASQSHIIANMALSYIGYGTLILQGASHNNCILLKRVTTTIDSVFPVGSSTILVLTHNINSFTFYDPLLAGNLVIFTYDTITDVGSGSTVSTYSASLNSNSTGISNLQSDEAGILYPNPVSDILNLKYSSLKNTYEIRITDLLGRTNLCQSVSANSTSEITSLDVSSLKDGCYVLSLLRADGISNRRFIKKN